MVTTAELFIVVGGECKVIRTGVEELPENVGLHEDGLTSIHAGHHFDGLKYGPASGAAQALHPSVDSGLIQLT